MLLTPLLQPNGELDLPLRELDGPWCITSTVLCSSSLLSNLFSSSLQPSSRNLDHVLHAATAAVLTLSTLLWPSWLWFTDTTRLETHAPWTLNLMILARTPLQLMLTSLELLLFSLSPPTLYSAASHAVLTVRKEDKSEIYTTVHENSRHDTFQIFRNRRITLFRLFLFHFRRYKLICAKFSSRKFKISFSLTS